MNENPNSTEDSDESARRAVELGVSGVMSAVRQSAAREMAEEAARAILMGERLDEIYFEDLESLEGVQEAVQHIVSPARRHAPVQTQPEGGTTPRGVTRKIGLGAGRDDGAGGRVGNPPLQRPSVQ